MVQQINNFTIFQVNVQKESFRIHFSFQIKTVVTYWNEVCILCLQNLLYTLLLSLILKLGIYQSGQATNSKNIVIS